MGETNDLSWLPEGEKAVAEREKELIPPIHREISEKLLALLEMIETNLEKNRVKKYTLLEGVNKPYAIKKALYKRLNQLFSEGYFNVDAFFETLTKLEQSKIPEEIQIYQLIDKNEKIKNLIDDLTYHCQEARLFKLVDQQGRFILNTDNSPAQLLHLY